MTIWCQGHPEGSKFRLYKGRDSEWKHMKESPVHSGQAYISLPNMSMHRVGVGQYQCSYSSAHHPEQNSAATT